MRFAFSERLRWLDVVIVKLPLLSRSRRARLLLDDPWKERTQKVGVLRRGFGNELGHQIRMAAKDHGAKDDLDPRQTLAFGSLSGMLQLPNAILELPFLGFEPFDFVIMSDWGFHKWEVGDQGRDLVS